MKLTQLLGPAALACAMTFTVGCKDDVSAIPTMNKEDVAKIYADKDAEKFRALFKDGIGENEQFEGIALTAPCVLFNWPEGLEILEDEGYDLDTVNAEGSDGEVTKGTNALLMAILEARVDDEARESLVRKLLELGADADFACTVEEDNWNGKTRIENITPLIMAAILTSSRSNARQARAHAICKLLLEEGADVDAIATITPPKGEAIRLSPLLAAAMQGDTDLIRILKEEGADPNQDLGNDTTPLSFAEKNHAPDDILNALRN